MAKTTFSCKNCTERYVGCHATCEIYKREFEANEKRKKDLKIEREINNYTNNAVCDRMDKEAIRKKRAGWYGRSAEY